MSDELLLKVCAVYSANIVSGPQSAMRAAIALIRAETLEEAAKVCLHEIEQPFDEWSSGYKDGCEENAAAIRALLKETP